MNPLAGEPRPCWHCRWWAGFAVGGVHGRCALPGGTPVQATPADGCAFWEREPGTDDEAGRPPPTIRLRP